MTGRLIQTYHIDELLGEGGMGAVYRATDTVLERPVALKMLRAELLNQPQILDRFRSEAQILAKLNHPNVATLYNFVREEGDYYMVMEYVEGQTLEQWLSQYGSLPTSLAVQVVQQALEGLHHAHKRGILHRDLKPANLMVTPEGVVKLTDFGIARIMGSQRMTLVNGLVGTPAYMAPEQIQGLEPSPQSDVHAMGLVLYELLSGQVPFAATSPFETMERVMRMVPPALRPQLAHLPPALDEILNKALQKDPANRFADARQFQKALLTVTSYVTALDEADVLAYQHPATTPSNPTPEPKPKPTPVADKTLIDRPSEPIVPVRPPEQIVPIRQPEPPKPATDRRRWKRVALWVMGSLVGFVVLSNVLVRSGAISPAVSPADSVAITTPQPVNSLTGQPQQPSSTPTEAPVASQEQPKPKPEKSNLPATGTVAEAAKPTTRQPVAPTMRADDDDDPDPVSVARKEPESPTRSSPAPTLPTPTPATPAPAPERTPPRPAPTDDRVADSRPAPTRTPDTRPAKPEPAETKGGSAGRRLKLSAGTEVTVALTESIAAATAKNGQAIGFQVTKSIVVEGEVLISQGASVQGEVVSASTSGKKDVLEIRINSIRGAGGQRVDIKGGTFRYVGDRNEPLVFRSGQSFVVYTAGVHRFVF
jgi:serine/threonine protein kinase